MAKKSWCGGIGSFAALAVCAVCSAPPARADGSPPSSGDRWIVREAGPNDNDFHTDVAYCAPGSSDANEGFCNAGEWQYINWFVFDSAAYYELSADSGGGDPSCAIDSGGSTFACSSTALFLDCSDGQHYYSPNYYWEPPSSEVTDAGLECPAGASTWDGGISMILYKN